MAKLTKRKIRKNRRKQLVLSVSSILFVALCFFIFRAIRVQADVATFYPSSCLGGWLNPFKATGQPDVSDNNSNSLSRDNSAVLPTNTRADIFCGDFKGEIPSDSEAKKIILTMSWDIAKDDAEVPKIISGDSFTDKAVNVLDATSSSGVSFTLTASSSTSDSTSSDSETTNGVPPHTPQEPTTLPAIPTALPTPDTTSSPSDASAPVTSFMYDIFAKPAFADEDTATSAPDTSLNASDTATVATEPAPTSSPVSTTTHSSVGANDTPTPATGNEFLEVFYTLDGTHWESLGRVDAQHLRYSIFEIPVPPDTKWSDISSIQIAVKSLSTIDNTPAVYLDGMTLQVTYGKANSTPFVSKSGLYFSKVNTSSPSFSFKLRDHEGIQEIVVSADSDLGSLAVYNSDTGVFQMYTYAPVNNYVIQPETFGEGNYTFIRTPDPSGCSSTPYLECKMGSLGDFGDFTVIRKDPLADQKSIDQKNDISTSTIDVINTDTSTSTIEASTTAPVVTASSTS